MRDFIRHVLSYWAKPAESTVEREEGRVPQSAERPVHPFGNWIVPADRHIAKWDSLQETS